MNRDIIQNTQVFLQDFRASLPQEKISNWSHQLSRYIGLSEASSKSLIKWGCPLEWATATLLIPLLTHYPDQEQWFRERISPEAINLALRSINLANHQLRIPRERKKTPWPSIQKLQKLFIASYQDEAIVFMAIASMLSELWQQDPQCINHTSVRDQETVLMPLLERFGLWELRREASNHLMELNHPAEKHTIYSMITHERERHACIIELVEKQLRQYLPEEASVSFHAVRPYRIFDLVREHKILEEKDAKEGWLHDLVSRLAFDIVLSSEDECYAALGAIHKLGRPITSYFDDYIAAPKYNGYRNLHTMVSLDPASFGVNNASFFIGSNSIWETNSWGRIAEWRASENDAKKLVPQAWWHNTSREKEILADFQPGEYRDPTYVFSPVGQLYEVVHRATPLDFAYAVHSDIGNQFRGADVNGRAASNDFILANGDIVNVQTEPDPKSRRQPHRLEEVRSTKAAYHIRKQHSHQLALAQKGRQSVQKSLAENYQRFGLRLSNEREDSYILNIADNIYGTDLDAFYHAVASGKISPENVANRITSKEMAHQVGYPDGKRLRIAVERVRFAQCCHPSIEDAIVGRFTQPGTEYVRVKIHKKSCPNIIHSNVVDLVWREVAYKGLHEFFAKGNDRERLLGDILTLFYDEGAFLHKVQAERLKNETAQILITAEVSDGMAANLEKSTHALPSVARCSSRPLTLSPDEIFAPRQKIRRENPFPYHLPARSRVDFVGRQQELQIIKDLIVVDGPPSPIIVYGPWRVGKTSLLEYIAEHDEEEFQAIAAMVSCHEVPNLSLESLLEKLGEVIADRMARQTNLLGLSHATFSEEDRLEIRKNPLGGFRRFLQRVKRVLDFKNGPRLLIMIDEFSDLHDAVVHDALSSSVFRNIRALIESESDILFILVIQSAVIEEMQTISSRGAELTIGTRFSRIGPLDKESVSELLKRRSSLMSLNCSDDVISSILRMSGCNPYVTNIICHDIVEQVLESGERSITDSHVDNAVNNRMREQLSVYFAKLSELVRNNLEWTILEALSLNGNPTWMTKDDLFANFDNHQSAPRVKKSSALHGLFNRGILVQQEDPGEETRYGLQIPIFARWITDQPTPPFSKGESA